jgi:serine/threonine protein kinase
VRGRESQNAKEGFLRESRVHGLLQHPNIVNIYDAGVLDSGELAIVMQYVWSRDLSVILGNLLAMKVADQGCFPLEARLKHLLL